MLNFSQAMFSEIDVKKKEGKKKKLLVVTTAWMSFYKTIPMRSSRIKGFTSIGETWVLPFLLTSSS